MPCDRPHHDPKDRNEQGNDGHDDSGPEGQDEAQRASQDGQEVVDDDANSDVHGRVDHERAQQDEHGRGACPLYVANGEDH